MATVTTRDVMRAGGLIRRIEEYREATGRQAWIKSTRVMQAIVAYARATRRDARKAKGGH